MYNCDGQSWLQILMCSYVWVIGQALGQDGWILAKFFFLRGTIKIENKECSGQPDNQWD